MIENNNCKPVHLVIVAMILILGQGYAFMQSYGALTMPDADMHTQ